jgi:hypothetical protein
VADLGSAVLVDREDVRRGVQNDKARLPFRREGAEFVPQGRGDDLITVRGRGRQDSLTVYERKELKPRHRRERPPVECGDVGYAAVELVPVVFGA